MAAATTGFLVVFIGGSLVFVVWAIFFLVWFCTAGTPGENPCGPDPKQTEGLMRKTRFRLGSPPTGWEDAESTIILRIGKNL